MEIIASMHSCIEHGVLGLELFRAIVAYGKVIERRGDWNLGGGRRGCR